MFSLSAEFRLIQLPEPKDGARGFLGRIGANQPQYQAQYNRERHFLTTNRPGQAVVFYNSKKNIAAAALTILGAHLAGHLGKEIPTLIRTGYNLNRIFDDCGLGRAGVEALVDARGHNEQAS